MVKASDVLLKFASTQPKSTLLEIGATLKKLREQLKNLESYKDLNSMSMSNSEVIEYEKEKSEIEDLIEDSNTIFKDIILRITKGR